VTSAVPTLREFAQGPAQSSIMPVADSGADDRVAPARPFQGHTESPVHIRHPAVPGRPGRGTAVRRTDSTFNCEPHALDFPVDNLEQLEADGLENMLREGAVAVAEVGALSHEKTVIDAALAAVGAGTGKSGMTPPIRSRTWMTRSSPLSRRPSTVR